MHLSIVIQLPFPLEKGDIDPNTVAALNKFRDKVVNGRLVKTWRTRAELEPLVLKSLIHAFNDLPQVGWIRGNNAASDAVLEQSNKALQENADLRSELARLSKVAKPEIEDLADFDSQFEFRYQTSSHNLRGSVLRTNGTASLTWRQIFIGLAGQLDRAKTDVFILYGVKEAMREAGIRDTPDSLNETDKIRIKVQFIALGLIQTTVSKTTQGGVAEFLSLTDKGRRAFIEGMVVRKQ